MTGTIPVHLFLGTLGSGKTTTILKILKGSEPGRRHAVLVNESGAVDLDAALLGQGHGTGEDLRIHEAPGGCICCSGEVDLKEGIERLLDGFDPDRILVEPTALADPATLVRQLMEQGSSWGVHLASVIGHLDVRLFRNPHILELPFWQHFLSSCHEIIATKVDLADADTLHAFVRAFPGDSPYCGRVHVGRDSFLSRHLQQAGSETGLGESVLQDPVVPLVADNLHEPS